MIGEWVNEKKDTIFLIFKKENKYFEKAFWETVGEEKYVKNPDIELRYRELIGLVILNNLFFYGVDTWEKGTIYDHREGKTYSSKITLKKGPNQDKKFCCLRNG